jgi:pimeloyl-ACP methyl ester carboxylesterase
MTVETAGGRPRSAAALARCRAGIPSRSSRLGPSTRIARRAASESVSRQQPHGVVNPTDAGSEEPMSSITVKDGTRINYKDWGSGPPVVFSHGWPLSSDAWEDQMFFLASRGYRCVAHDRRAHGRSSQPWNGHDMDTYADDLSALVGTLNLEGATFVGHSTGGGEVARYVGRHGTSRVAKAVLVSAVPPLMLKTASNPGGLSRAIARSTSRISARRFMARTGASRCRKVFETPSGCRACRGRSRASMTASRRSPRPT